jgi:hypothetical protein
MAMVTVEHETRQEKVDEWLPENTSSGYIHWTSGKLDRAGRVEMLRVLQTLAEMDRHHRVRRQVLHEPLSEADAAHFLVFLSPGSSRPTIG